MTLINLEAIQSQVCTELDQASTDMSESIVSFHAEVPEVLQLAMNKFIDRHPNWDQYRLIQAALSGFLVQHGVQTRSITRLYVGKMFALNSFN